MGEWEEDGMEGREEGREKSLLFGPMAVLQVVCVNTHTAIKT